MVKDHDCHVRKDLDDPDEGEDPWLFRGNLWLLNVYTRLFERRKDR